ncbi:response regulator [Paludisphaera sp.]|uniref:response regulator n=1 Tax=Paludisphaera sp. TaxID=2017432 RepID=UPI00301CE8F5
MTEKRPSAAGRGPGLGLYAGAAAVLAVFIISGVTAYLNTRTIEHNARLVMRTHEVLTALTDVLALSRDAETGQRGYILTGDVRYLDPYQTAAPRIEGRIAQLEEMFAGDEEQSRQLAAVRNYVAVKLGEMEETITLRRERGLDAALAVVRTDSGRSAMNAMRETVNRMLETERDRRRRRVEEMEAAYAMAVVGILAAGLLGGALTLAVASLLRRAAISRAREEWLQAGRIGLSAAVLGEQSPKELGRSLLRFLTDYLDAHAGAFFAAGGGGFRRVAVVGATSDDAVPEGFERGRGLLGRAAETGEVVVVRDVPDGYLSVGSALGSSSPRSLVVAPMLGDGGVRGVVELGFVHELDDRAVDLLGAISGAVAAAVEAAEYRRHLQDLLEETQRQAEEMQAQAEELRVSNEELDEQGRALKESQSRLELQQVELEQTNAQLGEQAAILETQRDELARKATELEQASRYKSDFLANMSHELRTPLNSSLILAKLLADNPTGNLTDEQVKFARTIQSAGDDLLTLINDILDLAKIEAGRMDVRPEPVPTAGLADDLRRTFDPIAAQKGLNFRVSVQPGCPEVVETDRQRLEQILRNLLSNAIKFTERGEVAMEIRRDGDGRVAFAASDTGIGIPREQHGVIFEAFRQADGTTNRKFGGTGLGLSIARDLAGLLGGGIALESEPGRGSTFTLTIPTTSPHVFPPTANTIADHVPDLPPPVPEPRRAPAPAAAPPIPFEDDRDRLTSKRVILVVEDDANFARVLYDMVRELGFQCLVVSTAEEAVSTAVQYLPSAVLLDVGLPDHSGLSVLDRIKHDARTRHIPVHVVSGGDYVRAALELGAVGYMLKPVKREEIMEVLRRLEDRMEQGLRRVLVVEDDPAQLEALRQLLATLDVETTGVRSAAECLERLSAATFDCMILDLSLPDASGYSLLETLSREDAYSFPPVIVYTGRDLSAEEEQRLRRYSRSIIIKGAKSPERLLDEVTLFLHRVVSDLPAEQRRMLEKALGRDSALEGRRILIVEDDVRNVYALSSILEPRGALVEIARNGLEALEALEKAQADPSRKVDLVLMDVMMPEMDGLTATREIRKRPEWKKLPIIALTAKAMRDDQARCLDAGANDYMAKPLDVDKILSLVRVWMPR